MPVSFGKLVVNGIEIEQPKTVVIEKIADDSNQTPTEASNGHTLIVNGKEKKIGAKSAYLLDMLTIDDE